MKKSFVFVLLCLIIQTCCASECVAEISKVEFDEINLPVDTPAKNYKLDKKDYRNNPEIQKDDDDPELNVDFVTTPLRLLKQYQSDIIN